MYGNCFFFQVPAEDSFLFNAINIINPVITLEEPLVLSPYKAQKTGLDLGEKKEHPETSMYLGLSLSGMSQV